MGKSTLLQQLSVKYPDYNVYREGDYCPIELAWCSYMTGEEYEAAVQKYAAIAEEIKRWTTIEEGAYIVEYTRIITDEPGFHKYMEQYEIYNGRRTPEEFERIIMERKRRLSTAGAGNLFECAFFQNIMDELILFWQISDEEIIAFYERMFAEIPKRDFLMYYLYGEDIEGNIRRIKEERSDNQGNPLWYPLMMEYLKASPYGKTHACEELEDLIAYLRHRQQLEMRVIREVLGDYAVVLAAKEYADEDIGFPL